MNVENHNKVIKQIKDHPETWLQICWHYCDTVHCYAGHAQLMSGATQNDATARRDARMFLDLSHREAIYMFAANRTLAELTAGPPAFVEGYLLRDVCGCEVDGDEGYDSDGYDRDGLDRNNKPRPEVQR